ncbi:MAG: hypothetical protein AAF570_28985 [Bacteroidota bacterium]
MRSRQLRQLFFVGVAMAALMGCIGCGGAGDDGRIKIPKSSLPEEIHPDTSYTRDMEAFEAYIKDRFRRGDTAAVDHEKLAAILPDAISGYKLDIDKAATFETNAFTFSEATRVFYDPDENYIEFIAGDYVSNPDFFRVNLQRYNLAQGIEVNGVTDKKRYIADLFPKNAEEFFTWSTYNKEKRIARVFFGLDYRYFITLEAVNQNGFLDMKMVRDWIDWQALYPAN